MKVILTDNLVHVTLNQMRLAHFVAELHGDSWKVVKNGISGDLGWMSWAEVREEIK